tara:strand:+ start:7991 stop:9247 length:1257 start_codon:yes stop_codon:yes gene_type:complete
MTANYTVNGIEYNWRTGAPVQSELVQDRRKTIEEGGTALDHSGYGKSAAGDDFFLSYPLKRNDQEDSLIIQAVKYIAPSDDGSGMGIEFNSDYKNALHDLQNNNTGNLSNSELHGLIQSPDFQYNGKKGQFSDGKSGYVKGMSMGGGMDSRYQGGAGDKHNSKTKFYVELPIPNELSDSQSVSWDASTMNAFEMAGATMAMELMKEPGATAANVQTAIDAAVGGGRGFEALGIEGGSDIAGGLRASLAGLGLKGFGSNVTPNQMMSRAHGKILNSNKELLFEGVNLRTFTFNFTFAPRSKDESKRVMKIIRALKTAMAPKAGEEYISGTGTFNNSGGIFLGSPDVFLLKYLHKGGEHPFLNKFKPCALTSFSVNYTGSNVWSSYYDGTPTLIKTQMAFSEMNPIYAEDYKKSGKGVGY